MRRPPIEILHRDSAYRSVAGILPRGLLHRSCQESSFRELLQRSHKEILPRDLFVGSLYRDLAKRSLTEILPGDHL